MSEEAQEAALDDNMPPLDEVVDESQNTESAPVEQEEAPVERDRVQERINKITADKYEEKRAREEAQRKAEELEREVNRLKQAVPVGDEPKIEDFDFDDLAYQSALIDYKVNKKAEELASQQQQQAQQDQAAKAQQSFNEKVASFMVKTPDYLDVINKMPQLNQQVVDAITISDDGPEVAYYLGKHLDVADEIATMSPIQAAIKIGQISSKISAQTNRAQPSAAPEPVSTLSSGGVVNKDMSDMTMDEIYNS